MLEPRWREGSMATVQTQAKSSACWFLAWFPLTFADQMDVWHSAAEEEMTVVSGEPTYGYGTETDWVYRCVMPCLYTKGRFVLTERIWGSHATAVVL